MGRERAVNLTPANKLNEARVGGAWPAFCIWQTRGRGSQGAGMDTMAGSLVHTRRRRSFFNIKVEATIFVQNCSERCFLRPLEGGEGRSCFHVNIRLFLVAVPRVSTDHGPLVIGSVVGLPRFSLRGMLPLCGC